MAWTVCSETMRWREQSALEQSSVGSGLECSCCYNYASIILYLSTSRMSEAAPLGIHLLLLSMSDFSFLSSSSSSISLTFPGMLCTVNRKFSTRQRIRSTRKKPIFGGRSYQIVPVKRRLEKKNRKDKNLCSKGYRNHQAQQSHGGNTAMHANRQIQRS